jgi:hypothetical protein
MANQKYNNLTVLMTTGGLNWPSDPIDAYLMKGAVYDATDVTLPDVGASQVLRVPVGSRMVGSTGALLGAPVSFNRVPKDETFQVIIAKDRGPVGPPLVLAFYDEDNEDQPLTLQNNGTLIVRPELATDPELPPQVGVWVAI